MNKTLCRFFTIADYLEEEEWLRKQHKNGWKLVSATAPCFYKFEKCEPEDVIYRLEFKNNIATSEYKQLFQDYGWEYFHSCLGWNYFRKPATEAKTTQEEELFSDNESKLEMIEHIIKTRMLPLVVIFLCCIVPNISNVTSHTHGVLSIILSVVFFTLFIIYIFLFIHCGSKLKKLRDLYK